MTGVSLPKEQHLPHSNGLGQGGTRTRRMDELIRALHSYTWAKMQTNDSTSGNTQMGFRYREDQRGNITKEATDSLRQVPKLECNK